MAREIIENIDLDYNESIISLDVKSLYTNVPLKEAIRTLFPRIQESGGVSGLELLLTYINF